MLAAPTVLKARGECCSGGGPVRRLMDCVRLGRLETSPEGEGRWALPGRVRFTRMLPPLEPLDGLGGE